MELDPLEEFFNGRYITKTPYMSESGWSWRNGSYDDGYEEVSRADLLRLLRLLVEHLFMDDIAGAS